MNEEVEELLDPVDEAEVLAAVSADADADEIAESIETRAECCVVHLCGCK